MVGVGAQVTRPTFERHEERLVRQQRGVVVSKWRDTVLGVVGLLVLIVLGLGLLVGIFDVARAVWHSFVALPKEVAVAIVAASATIFASALAVVVGQYLQRQATIRQDIRKANAPAYEKWVDMWFHVLFAEQMGREPLSEKDVVRLMSEFSKELTLWGSDRAVRDWVNLRLAFVTAADADPGDADRLARENMLRMAQFIKTIRRDMGHRNRKLDDVTILGLFINDAQEAFGPSGAK